MLTTDFIAGYWCGNGWFYNQPVGKYRCFTAGIDVNNDEAELLQEIQRTLKIGYVKAGSGKHANVIKFIFSKADEVLKFSDEIGAKLQGRKKKQFDAWFAEFKAYKNSL